MIDLPVSKDWKDQGGTRPCAVCGRNVRPGNGSMIHLHRGGSVIVTEEEATALNLAGEEGGDLGGYAIGDNCLRRYPQIRPYAVRCQR